MSAFNDSNDDIEQAMFRGRYGTNHDSDTAPRADPRALCKVAHCLMASRGNGMLLVALAHTIMYTLTHLQRLCSFFVVCMLLCLCRALGPLRELTTAKASDVPANVAVALSPARARHRSFT